MSIAGGNYQIFQRMLEHSKADVRLSTSVETIEPSGSGFRVLAKDAKFSNDSFDEVIFAAPWHLSPVSKQLSSHFSQPIP